MKVTHISINSVINHEQCIATIGNFDALHFGHKVLINDAIRKGKKLNLPVCLITFSNDPISIIYDTEVPLLTPLEYRLTLCETMGLDEVIVLDFTKEMCDLDAIDFIEKVLVPLNIKEIVCGYDFSFGKQALGNVDLLAKYIKTSIIEEVVYFEERISTTKIKELLSNGDIEFANTLLKREFAIMGKVIKGHQIGRTINYPTANIDYYYNQFMPKLGVYIGKVVIDNIEYPAMVNIGHNPTFHDKHDLTIEAHILDFDSDIYDKTVVVKFLKYLRNEIKFASSEQLITQLNIDKDKVKEYFV